MDNYEEITLDNVRLGAEVVSKVVYEAYGVTKCRIGRISRITRALSSRGLVIAGIHVDWAEDNGWNYHPDQMLIKVEFGKDNPNNTFAVAKGGIYDKQI